MPANPVSRSLGYIGVVLGLYWGLGFRVWRAILELRWGYIGVSTDSSFKGLGQ